MTAAQIPTLAWVGATPTTRLPAAMSSIEVVMENRRPRRSASHPNTNPPMGRMKNPTANTARVDNRAPVGLSSTKNWAAKNGAKIA
jgi:hypothetical protein